MSTPTSFDRVLERFKNAAEILAFLGAASWGIWLFYYRDVAVPATVPARLTVSSRLEIVGRTSTMVLVKTTIKVRNEASVRVHLVGSVFNIKAHHVVTRDQALSPNDPSMQINNAALDFVGISKSADTDGGDIVTSGRLFPINGWWVDASEEQDVEFMAYVPNGYDVVNLRSEFRMSRELDDRLSIKWDIDEKGSASMALKVTTNGQSEIYDHDTHYKLLKAATPYRAYSLATLAIASSEEQPLASAHNTYEAPGGQGIEGP